MSGCVDGTDCAICKHGKSMNAAKLVAPHGTAGDCSILSLLLKRYIHRNKNCNRGETDENTVQPLNLPVRKTIKLFSGL